MKNRIEILLKTLTLTQKQFAESLNITANNITEWKKGRSMPTAKVLKKIMLKHNVSVDWLLTGEGEMFLSDTGDKDTKISDIEKDKLLKKIGELTMEVEDAREIKHQKNKITPVKFAKVNLYDGKITAGNGGNSYGQIVEILAIPTMFLADGLKANYGAIRVEGNSMEPSIQENSTIIFNFDRKPENGEVGAFRYEDELIVKRLRKTGSKVELVSDNKAYKPIIVKEADNFAIVAKAVSSFTVNML